jgi:hypothetical protein
MINEKSYSVLFFIIAFICIAGNAHSINLCQNPEFYCVSASKNMSWKDFWPNEKERVLIMKSNRYNEDIKTGMQIAIPKDLNRGLIGFSPFAEKINPIGEKVLIFDPKLFGWAVYDSQGMLIRWGPATGGIKNCPENTSLDCSTIVGKYTIILKGGKNYRSSKYPIRCGDEKNPCAPMPWFMKFDFRGYGFHGSEKMNGKHTSHGCVRIFVDDAEWLNKNFVEVGTKVIIKPYK